VEYVVLKFEFQFCVDNKNGVISVVISVSVKKLKFARYLAAKCMLARFLVITSSFPVL